MPSIAGPLYDETLFRTFFLEFENADWEAELDEFHDTDVEIPATLTVDGKQYPRVGVRFRGMSSYGGVSPGSKRSLNLSIDKAIEADTRKLSSYAEFKQALSAEPPPAADAPRGPRPGMTLRTFVEQRRQYLLDHEEIKKLPPAEAK